MTIGYFDIPVTCLKDPKQSHLLREPDCAFIDVLKKEMLENTMAPSLVSPIIGLVCLDAGDSFDRRHPHSYMYETIGGNNSRVALQELSKEFPYNKVFKSHLVAVYTGFPDNLVLRLASKHNRATGFTHSVITQEKVN